MYNVLTIDLDYIAEPYIQLYHSICNESSVEKQWDKVFSDPAIVSNNLDINPDNLIYALDIFSRGLTVCKNVAFGITHDSILFELEDKDDLNILNIDHHHDILYPGNHSTDLGFGLVYEGSWIEYLHRKGKISNYVWIRNLNSFNIDTHSTIVFSTMLSADYEFEMVPDLIFVCLSPTYIPKFHWFYFKIFMNMYKAFNDGEIRFYKKPYTNSPYSDPMRGYEDFLQQVVK